MLLLAAFLAFAQDCGRIPASRTSLTGSPKRRKCSGKMPLIL